MTITNHNALIAKRSRFVLGFQCAARSKIRIASVIRPIRFNQSVTCCVTNP